MAVESYERLVAHPKAKSEVWQHFGFPGDSRGTIIDRKKVFCRICQPPVPIAYSGNTSNLTYHLQKRHPEHLNSVLKAAGGKNDEQLAPVLQQPTLLAVTSSAKPYPQGSNRAKQLVDATANFICRGLQPISVVDESSFRELLDLADHRFQLPHRTYFSTKVIPEKYSAVRAKVEKELAAIADLTITTDLWTASHQHRSYISLTVHFVDPDLKLQSICLQTLEVPQDHSAQSLQEVLSSMFEGWKIKGKLFGRTTDNGQNIVNAIGLLGIHHFPCVAHTLQLGIKKALEVPKVRSTIACCKKLIEHFKKSTKETYKLREKQTMLQLPEHQLIQDCPTRWGSTLGMLKRLLEQQAAIAAVLVDGKVRHLMPEGGDWAVIEDVVRILQPFQDATEAMSTEKYPSISSMKPLLYKLLEKTLLVKVDDSSTTKNIKQAIKSDLVNRYQGSDVLSVMNVCTYLDPRYKQLPFLSKAEKELVIEEVKDELFTMYDSNHTLATTQQDDLPVQGSSSSESSAIEPPGKKAKIGPMMSLLGDVFSTPSTVLQPRLAWNEKVTREISLYEAEESAELDSDPLLWWKSRRVAYPIISKLVQKQFSIVATSVPSERLFSSAGSIITEKRNSLRPENADRLIFLYENSHL